eukprot:10227428-Ditylum_brightwellii.AAC.1
MVGTKTANGGRINPHREKIPRETRERQETAKSIELAHEQPATQTTSRTTHNNCTHKFFPAFSMKEMNTDNSGYYTTIN